MGQLTIGPGGVRRMLTGVTAKAFIKGQPRLLWPFATQVLAGQHTESQGRVRQQAGSFAMGKLCQAGFEGAVKQVVWVLDRDRTRPAVLPGQPQVFRGTPWRFVGEPY